MQPNSFWQNLVNQNIGTYVPKAAHGQNLINFAPLENALGCSPKINTLTLPLHVYPGAEIAELKTKIANWLKVTPDMIILGAGSDDLINLIPQVFLEPGEKVFVKTPTFFRILEAVHRVKGQLVNNPESAKLIWLCDPNNPTGEVINNKNINTDKLTIIDEAYQEIFDPDNKQSAIKLLDKFPNLLVTKTFSKAFGLAGIRVGFAVGNPKLISALSKWQTNFPISSVSAQIAQMALDDLGFLNFVHNHFKAEREYIFRDFENIEYSQSQTNVFIARHKKAKLFDLLLKEGILTADFNQMNGLEGQGFVRVTIKNRKENELLVAALKKLDKAT